MTLSGLYVHIPYCHSKCGYCDFYSTPGVRDEGLMVDALISEYALRRHEVKAPIATVYLGGGTPSILAQESLRRLLDALPTAEAGEVTIEVNPEDVSAERALAWRDMGINRVSMGVQSLVDSELRLIGRRHDAATALRAVETLRSAGIGNLSLDLIYALPTQSLESWEKSIDGLLALRPEHLSAYMLTYEPRTRLTAMLKTGKIEAVDEDTSIEMYRLLTAKTRSHGYDHYEISNFALPGYRSRHNSSYWDGTPYLGLGPSAHSYDGEIRRINLADIKRYTELVMSGAPAYEEERETRAERYNDLVITRLRTAAGLDIREVPVGRRRQLLTDVYPYLKSGDVEIEDQRLVIPEMSWLISDTILRDLMQ